MPQDMHEPKPYKSSKRLRKKRRRQAIGVLVLLLGVALLGVAAYLTSRYLIGQPKPASSTVLPPVVSQSQASSSSSISTPEPLPSIPAATGELDVAGVPPLYNRSHTIPAEVAANVEANLSPVGAGQLLETRAATAFLQMENAALEEGVSLLPVSGYRSNQRQTSNYNSSIDSYLAQGYDRAEAVRLTEQYYAIPGTSEHEVGLAMDIGEVNDNFANTAAYAWLQEHCNEYGFIYRYQKEYVNTTYIAWEPWHYRFVGKNHAEEMARLGYHTLEDYVGYLNGLA